jgi:DNA-directed RNA polymerase specialized sigma24 family protein
MKTATRTTGSLHTHSTPTPANDTQLRDDFDQLVRRACAGDRHAVGAIAIALGPTLLADLRAWMGPWAQDADDVLHDFFVVLLEGTSRFPPARGRGLSWIRGVLRAMARRYCADRRRDWYGG